MSVNVPVDTIEKPITVIDYIAGMSECVDMKELSEYASRCPERIVIDDRFGRAFKARLDVIKSKKRAA